MTPTNIKFIVKNNHLKITMDLEKQSGSLTRSSSFTRMFPISHEVDKSKAKTIIKNNEVSITLPKL